MTTKGGRSPRPQRPLSPPTTVTAAMGPKGLGRPFTARNRPFTACATTRREAVSHTIARLEKRLERQNEQLLLEKIGLREEQVPPTPEEIYMRRYYKRREMRKLAEQRAEEANKQRAKVEAAQRAAERAEALRLEALKAEEEKAEATRIAKKMADAEKAAKAAATAARIAERNAREQEKRMESKKHSNHESNAIEAKDSDGKSS